MPAANTDKLKKLSRRWVGQIGSGGVADAVVTTIPLSSATNLATDTAVVATIDRVDADGDATSNLEETVIGVVSGSNLVNCTRGVEGTAQAHSAGAVVEILVTAKGWNDIVDHLLVGHNQDGSHGASVIVSSNIAASAVTSGRLAASAVVAGNIAASAIVSGNLAASSVVAGNLAASSVNQGNLNFSISNLDGWVQYSAVTPTRTSSDDPTYVLTFAGVDLTSTLSVGMKVRITQSTTKYFVITAVAFSTNTTVTLYGGTDYDVADTGVTAISAFYYSTSTAPFGFPLDPSKWTVLVTDTTDRSQASPVQNTWYNLGTTTISIPIGTWDVQYWVSAQSDQSGSAGVFVTLSTANNSESDTANTSNLQVTAAFGGATITKRNVITVASKTTYYLNTRTQTASVTTIYNRNGSSGSALRIEARCPYI